MAEVVKVLSAIDLESKYSWVISNIDMDTTGDLGIISIKKYWWHASQIKNKIDWLYNN